VSNFSMNFRDRTLVPADVDAYTADLNRPPAALRPSQRSDDYFETSVPWLLLVIDDISQRKMAIFSGMGHNRDATAPTQARRRIPLEKLRREASVPSRSDLTRGETGSLPPVVRSSGGIVPSV
jgi:hypothetical protein